MKTIIKILFIGLTGIIFQSCIISGVTGSRNVTTENREISKPFDKLKVSQGIEVILTQGPTVSVSIEADDNLHDILMTEVVNNELKIYFEKNVQQRKSSKVYLTMPNITGINTSSGSSINGQNTFEVNQLDLNSSSGSEINLKLNAQDIDANSSSGSLIHLSGTCQFIMANSSSGSEIDASELVAQDAKVEASSGSNIDINAIEKFTGNASSGGSVECIGNPKVTDISKSSGGSVEVKQ